MPYILLLEVAVIIVGVTVAMVIISIFFARKIKKAQRINESTIIAPPFTKIEYRKSAEENPWLLLRRF